MERADVFTETLMRLAKKMDYRTTLVSRNLYVKFPNTGKRFKIYLDDFSNRYLNIDGFMCIAINKDEGVIDKCGFRFCDYFDKVACSPNSPKWIPYIDGNDWHSSRDLHCLPKESDFKRIAEAIDEYIEIMR